MSWRDLETKNPELAACGLLRLSGLVAYLAAVRKDGSPRVHPMTPIIGDGCFFEFMEPIEFDIDFAASTQYVGGKSVHV
jgi:hypothetical protein